MIKIEVENNKEKRCLVDIAEVVAKRCILLRSRDITVPSTKDGTESPDLPHEMMDMFLKDAKKVLYIFDSVFTDRPYNDFTRLKWYLGYRSVHHKNHELNCLVAAMLTGTANSMTPATDLLLQAQAERSIFEHRIRVAFYRDILAHVREMINTFVERVS